MICLPRHPHCFHSFVFSKHLLLETPPLSPSPPGLPHHSTANNMMNVSTLSCTESASHPSQHAHTILSCHFRLVLPLPLPRLSANTLAARQACHKFLDVSALDDAAAAAAINHDKVHILIDLNGWSGGHRVPLISRRPAPIQVRACARSRVDCNPQCPPLAPAFRLTYGCRARFVSA